MVIYHHEQFFSKMKHGVGFDRKKVRKLGREENTRGQSYHKNLGKERLRDPHICCTVRDRCGVVFHSFFTVILLQLDSLSLSSTLGSVLFTGYPNLWFIFAGTFYCQFVSFLAALMQTHNEVSLSNFTLANTINRCMQHVVQLANFVLMKLCLNGSEAVYHGEQYMQS